MNNCAAIIGAVLVFTAPLCARAAGDAGPGKAVFTANCAICHSLAEGANRIGPSLFGVSGRAAGEVAGYAYSPAMKASAKTWNDDTLSAFIAKPSAVVPGSKMLYPGLADAKARQDLIAYLATLQ